MIEAEEALGRKPSAATLRAARMLVDQALASGFDHRRGQIFEYGSAYGPALVDRSTQWWCQFEMVNAFLLMDELLRPGDRPVLGAPSRRRGPSPVTSWPTTQYPGVCAGFGRDAARSDCESKSHDWFVSYHTARALLLTADRLRQQPAH